MKKKLLKLAAFATAAVALVAVTVVVTVAYLTSSSAVSNTFTVGNVGIKMFESKVDADGKAIADDANINGTKKDSDGNNYHLMPGKTYDKDPTIYINDGSDSSYLFVKVRNNIVTIEDTSAEAETLTIAEQMALNGWQEYVNTSTGMVYVYTGLGSGTDGAYTEDDLTKIANKQRPACPVGGTTNYKEIDVFETFTVAKDADVSLYGGAKVTLTAFAIQTAGFEDDAAGEGTKKAIDYAWEAIVAAYPYEGGAVISE